MNKKEYVEQLIKDTNRTILEIERKKRTVRARRERMRKKIKYVS